MKSYKSKHFKIDTIKYIKRLETDNKKQKRIIDLLNQKLNERLD
jgi:hypothetical protein